MAGELQPLHKHARDADWAAVIADIEAGADVNAGGPGGYTPLMYAMSRRLEAESRAEALDEIIQLLLQNGASPMHTTEDGESAFMFAVQQVMLSHVELMLPYVTSQWLNTPYVDFTGQQNPNGWTMLHFVAWHACFVSSGQGQVNALIARQLLAAGADPFARDRQGNTPLAIAQAHGNQPVIDVLLQAMAQAQSHSFITRFMNAFNNMVIQVAVASAANGPVLNVPVGMGAQVHITLGRYLDEMRKQRRQNQ